jgi:ABC-type phosphate/phosphonate transport system substrate-binding protein
VPDETILLGAVAYDPKVVTIWEGIRGHFQDMGVPLDFVLFSNYEQQIELLLKGRIDIAWNTPLAHVRVQQRSGGRTASVGMRDSDRDFRAQIVVRRDAGIRQLSDLAGKRLAVGSRDSTQARILPLYLLRQAGVDLRSIHLVRFDTDVGKHGDTGTSEIEVLAALGRGEVEAGAVGDLIWINQQAAGQVDTGLVTSLWATPAFDHCMFDARAALDDSKIEAFQQALFAMRWENPQHRRLLELEGLKQWMPPREEGYDSLRAALAEPEVWS